MVGTAFRIDQIRQITSGAFDHKVFGHTSLDRWGSGYADQEGFFKTAAEVAVHSRPRHEPQGLT